VIQARDVTEIVRHARAFAEEFSDVTEICFQLEWKGLKSRIIASLIPNATGRGLTPLIATGEPYSRVFRKRR